ncbi:MAG TPA: FecR/PupR family sigma factor regulator, partial [Pirellulales bacterium]|nr:FecR/PupR family sigma factor regulator [Pirellulales bacterium]
MTETSKHGTDLKATPRDALEAAAQWHGVFDDGEPDAGQRERFETWLAADLEHRAAYASVERAWSGMTSAGVDRRILAMRRAALAA